ncbi:MAG: SRPBCC family protein [Bradymonadaceae bacterium]
MPTFEKTSEMPVSANALYQWHMQPGAFEALVPPWQEIEVVERPEPLEEGTRLVMKLKIGPMGIRWVAHHREFIEGRQFVDEQLEGPFARWVHTHRFKPIGEETSELVDHIDYELPLGALGRLFGRWKVKRDLERMFEYRHEVTRREVAESGQSRARQ